METNEITIIVKGKAGSGKSTVGSRIAALLANDGFNVLADNSDEFRGEFNTPGRLNTLLRKNTTISIHHVQEHR